jgi:hypothetical protein
MDFRISHLKLDTPARPVAGSPALAVGGIAGFSADSSASHDQVLRVQSGGRVIAEVHLLAPCRWLCGGHLSVSSSGDATYMAGNGTN